MTKEQSTIHVGIDVSKDKLAVAIAGGGVRDDVLSLGAFENAPASIDRLLTKLSGRGSPVSVCYEAGPTGYGLYRQVRAFGFECCVVAPSLVPVRAGERVKTDRLDAIRLARLLRAGELTPIWVPDETHEAMRDPVRARESAAEDLRHKRQLVSAFMLRHGRVYHRSKPWTMRYRRWLQSQSFDHPAHQIALQEMNRPGLPRGFFVQNFSGAFKSIHLCMELIFHFLRRGPVARLCRSFDHVSCRKGEHRWLHDRPRNSAPKPCALR